MSTFQSSLFPNAFWDSHGFEALQKPSKQELVWISRCKVLCQLLWGQHFSDLLHFRWTPIPPSSAIPKFMKLDLITPKLNSSNFLHDARHFLSFQCIRSLFQHLSSNTFRYFARLSFKMFWNYHMKFTAILKITNKNRLLKHKKHLLIGTSLSWVLFIPKTFICCA